MSLTVPELRTARLTLRAHRIDDFDACAVLWADPIVTKHIGGRAFTREEVWSKILRYGGLWALLGYGYWVVEETASGRFVGEVGFADFRRDLTPSLGDQPEGGWVLAPWSHGAGIATEAVQAALRWTDEHLPGRSTVCLIDAGHAASVRVAEKCGYRHVGPATYKGGSALVMRR